MKAVVSAIPDGARVRGNKSRVEYTLKHVVHINVADGRKVALRGPFLVDNRGKMVEISPEAMLEVRS